MRKLNVLYLNHIGHISGAEIVQMRMIERLDNTRFFKVGMCPFDSILHQRYQNMMEAVEPLPFSSDSPGALTRIFQYLSSMCAVHHAVRKHKIDLIHANTFRSALIAGPVGRLLGKPVIWHMYDILKRKPRNRLLVWLYSYIVQAIVGVSDATARGLLDLGAKDEKVKKIYSGLPVDELWAKVESLDGSSLYQFNGKGPAVAMFGQITPWKGQDVLLAAIPKVLQKRSDVHFFFIGDGMGPADKEFKARLQQQARELGLNEKISWLGFRADVPALMRQADLIVHCSVHPDPLPTVVLEGMALERPVVASRIGGVPEIIGDAQAGYMFQPGNADELAERIVAALADRNEMAAVGRRAAQRVREQFGMDKNMHELVCLYREVTPDFSGWREEQREDEYGEQP